MFKFIAKIYSPYKLELDKKCNKKLNISLTQNDDTGYDITIEADEFIYNPVNVVKYLFENRTIGSERIAVQYYGNPDCSDKYTQEQQEAYELFCRLYAMAAGESWTSLITFFNSHYPNVERESLTKYTAERLQREVAGQE